MIKKSNILNLLILNSLLLLAGCNSEEEDSLTPPASLRFVTDVRSGEENPLLKRVNALLRFLGPENEEAIATEILIDNNGQGNIEHLTEGRWHISYWDMPSGGQLYFDKSDKSIMVPQTDKYVREPPSFYAGVSVFNYIPNEPIRLNLKPQTGVLTIVLIFDEAANLPGSINGVLSGIVSKRVFGEVRMNISEQGIGYVPYIFTPSSYSPSTYVASRRLLGISNTQKCELVFSNDNISSSPIKIDLTTKLEAFNDLTSYNTLCTIHIDDRKIETTIEVIDWEERNYELDI
ncbi:hypothetical protein EZS27_009673 [termite gut metagenome]|uniref:Uncharacterized protein n=1 Tax=termite gut metagenome TaxID=433724 RepID=A0A5J4SBE4_9ZZZZ